MSKLSQFCRNDGFNPSVDVSDPIVRTYIHKQYVSRVGDTEDDFVIEERPFLKDEFNIQKKIQEEAKTTDLKYLLQQLFLTGDESVLNKRPCFYGDISSIQQSIADGSPIVKPEEIRETLPEEIKGLTVAQIASMSDEDIAAYVAQVKEQAAALAKEQIDEGGDK